VVIAACGASAKPVAAPAKGAVPAAHYAALFEAGKSWRYHVKAKIQMYEPDDPKADASGQVIEDSEHDATCAVAEARAWKGGVMSRVECDQAISDSNDPLTGAWVADARGLWRVDELPEKGDPDLADARMVIASAPTAGKHEQKGTGDEEGFGESTEIVAEGSGWCVTYTSWGGDESYDTLCFAGGVVRGAAGWAGGSSHETTFELIR